MAYISKTFAVCVICSILLYNCQSLPLEPETTATRKEIPNINKSKENLTSPSKAKSNIVSTTMIGREPEMKAEKNKFLTNSLSYKSDKAKMTTVKLKNTQDLSETSFSKTNASISKENSTRILKDLTTSDKFNKSEKSNRSSSAVTDKVVRPLNTPENKDDKAKSKEDKNKSDLLEPKKNTVKIAKEKFSTTFKIDKTQDSATPKDKPISRDDKVEDSKINTDPDNQLAPASDDDLYNKFTDDNDDDEEANKEKQINKPDFSNYSDKRVPFNKDEKYDYIDGAEDNMQENRNKEEKVPSSNVQQTFIPNKTLEMYDDANSHFFAYLLTVMVMAVLFYLLFHNKQRIIALMIEGRGSRPTRRGGARAKYHKLDNNLEEAMSSMRSGGTGSTGSTGSTNNIY